jgi:hypothetical protein
MLQNILSDLLFMNQELLLIVFGFVLYNFHYGKSYENNSMIINIIISAFTLAIFDVFLKHILLLHVNNDYYKFVINNVVTIVVIDFLIYLIKGQLHEKSLTSYFNLAFACLFYETIVYKLYNYNNLCNNRLRNITKTIMRLATIHILSNYMDDKPFDDIWFNFSFGQLFNFSLFNIVFTN